MTDHPHDTSHLVRRNDASPFTFGGNLVLQSILLGFENGRLMQTDSRSVDAHIRKNNIRINYTARQPQIIRQRERYIQQNIVVRPMAFPKFAVNITLSVLRVRAMQMGKIHSENTRHQRHAA